MAEAIHTVPSGWRHKGPRNLTVKYRPRTWDQLWNAGRDTTIRWLRHLLETGAAGRFSIFAGPSGAAKTLVALLFAMAASCLRWRDTRLGCGYCPACEYVAQGTDYKRARFIEIDATWENIDDDIFHGVNYFNGTLDLLSDNPAPAVVLVDEAHRLKLASMEKMLKYLDRPHRNRLILATTKLDRLEPALVKRAGGRIYHFAHPLVEEAALHLDRIAAEEGARLDEGVAIAIARQAKAEPRLCLGLLEDLLSIGPHITMDMLTSLPIWTANTDVSAIDVTDEDIA